MSDTVGTIRGQMVLDVKQALSAFTQVRLANLQTVTALRTGGGALVAAGAGMTALGVGMVGALLSAAGAAAEFERKLDFFGAVSDSSVADMEAIRVKALQLGQDTIFSADQIADSFVELGKAGVNAKDIIDGVGEGVAALGAAADIPLDTAANIMLSAVQTFQLSADQAVHVADLLAGAANSSIVEVEDLGVSLKYAGGTAQALGMPLEDVITALGLLGKYGIKGSTAGTSLRQTLLSLGGTTKKAKAELKDLGIITEDGSNKFYNADGTAKSLAEIFQILQDATAGMSAEQKVATYRTIFQTRAMSTALSLTKEGAAGFDAMAASINKIKAADVASKRLDNLSGDIEILRGNIDTLVIQEGSQLQGFLRGIVQWVTKVIQAFSNLDPTMQKVIIITTAVTGVLLILLGVVTTMAGSLLILVSTYKILAPAIQLAAKATKAWAVAQWAANSAMLANPVTWIVLAIVALIAAIVILIWKWDEIMAILAKGRAALGRWFRGVGEAIMAWFRTLPAWFAKVWNKVLMVTNQVWTNVLNFIKSIPGRLVQLFLNFTLIGLLIKHWNEIKTYAINTWNNILAFIGSIPGRIGDFFSALPGLIGYWIGFALGTVVRLTLEALTWWGNVVNTAITAVVTFFSELPGKVIAFFVSLYNLIVTNVTAFAIWWVEKVKSTIASVIKFFQELPGKIRDFFVLAKAWVIEKFTEFSVWVVQKAQDIVKNVVEFFKHLPENLRDIFITVNTWVGEKFNLVKDKALEIAKAIYTGIRDWVTKIPEKVKEIFLQAIQNVKDLVGKATDAVKDFGSGLWEGFKDGLGIHSPSYIERAMWQITGVLDDETQNMKSQVRTIQGMGNQISEAGDNMGSGFDATLSANLASMQSQLDAAMDYSRQLQRISDSTAEAVNANAGNLNMSDKVIVQGGNIINLDVEWNAAENDSVSTVQQVKDLLGRSSVILADDLEDPNGN